MRPAADHLDLALRAYVAALAIAVLLIATLLCGSALDPRRSGDGRPALLRALGSPSLALVPSGHPLRTPAPAQSIDRRHLPELPAQEGL